jgi:hypothetical protein
VAGDMVKAKAAYDDFLGLWKDANADIPLLKQAKAEYTKFGSSEEFVGRFRLGQLAK